MSKCIISPRASRSYRCGRSSSRGSISFCRELGFNEMTTDCSLRYVQLTSYMITSCGMPQGCSYSYDDISWNYKVNPLIL